MSTRKMLGWTIAFVAALGVVVSFATVSFAVQAQRTSRAGCERAKLDRSAQADGWRTAERARWSSFARDGQVGDFAAAISYGLIVRSLESRTGSRLDCRAEYPDPLPYP
jgi:hypothetical protein